jgi:hypothetical protein
MTFQPRAKALRQVESRSSSVIPLLITRRRRSLPASGARVKPVLRTRLIWSMMAGLSVPTRIDGMATET